MLVHHRFIQEHSTHGLKAVVNLEVAMLMVIVEKFLSIVKIFFIKLSTFYST